MTNLVISTNNVDILEITNNADLETIDLSGMTAIGAAGTASTSNNNNLEASVADDENDSFTSESGMATAKAYLDAVAADADSKNVVFDLVESALDADGNETSDVADYVVLKLTPKIVTTPAQDAQKHKKAWGITIRNGDTTFSLKEPDGANLLVNGSEVAQNKLTLDANEILAIAAIKRSAALTRATAYDLTLDAFSGYKPTGLVSSYCRYCNSRI